MGIGRLDPLELISKLVEQRWHIKDPDHRNLEGGRDHRGGVLRDD